MDKEEELKNMELQEQENEDMEGEDYDEDFNENGHDIHHDMEGEEDIYDEGDPEDPHDPYAQGDAIRNTFYPSQNPIMAGGFGGALRPVSANVMKDRNKRVSYGRPKIKKPAGFSRGIEDEFDARTRPRNFVKDKEGLYDDAIKLKKANNSLK
jgi:hypothetical protein